MKHRVRKGSNSRRKRIGIKWKMFAILMSFVFVLALVIWVFQIRMQTFFFQKEKHEELLNTVSAISESSVENGELGNVVKEYALEYYSDIWVYSISNGEFDYTRPIAFVEGTKDSIGSYLEKSFELLYSRTVENGGTYTAIVPTDHLKESYFDLDIIEDNLGSPEKFPMVLTNLSQVSVMHITTCKIDGGDYLIIQRANITPIKTMVNTIENQFLFVGVFMIVITILLATVMSKLITKPIIKINENAKGLAAGKYNIELTGHGYREIDELSDTLNYVAGELSKNDRLQKELIANISHDLRTPLTMIKGYSEVMRDIPGENTADNIQVIIDETARLTELVNDMLDLSKIQSGTRRTEMRVFSLTDIVRSTIQRYEKLTMQNGYNIEFIAAEEVDVYADSGMILQVVYNLINNAINYSGDDRCVIVRQAVSDNVVRISVSDNGKGISEEEIPYIWDRYYKVDKVHRRTMVGTGLGLSIVKEILELHNATYGVTSIPQNGSTFWFELNTVDSSEYQIETV